MISPTDSPSSAPAEPERANVAGDQSAEERRARLRERLVDEAYTLLSTEGLLALQARRVAQCAGCSVGAIYNVFPDLDELILRANTRTMARLADAATLGGLKIDPSLGAGERIRLIALVYVDFVFNHEQAWRSLFEYRATYRKPYPQWYRDAQIKTLVDLGAALCGRPVKDDEELRRVETLWAAVHGVVSTAMDARFREATRADIERQVDALTQLLMPGIDRLPS
jgi:AcrR family transcriptional regulator